MPQSPTIRFLAKINRTADCWEWTGARGAGRVRYGNFHPSKNKAVSAHRFAYELFIGPIPNGLFVCHRCDNPICVRPEHMFLGTAADNNRDMYAKGRGNTQRQPELMLRMQDALRASGKQIRGEQCHAARLNPDAVRDIRQRFATGHVSKASLARAFGVSEASIFAIMTGQTWRHVA